MTIENSIKGILEEIASNFEYEGWDVEIGETSIAVCADAEVNRVFKIEIREIGKND